MVFGRCHRQEFAGSSSFQRMDHGQGHDIVDVVSHIGIEDDSESMDGGFLGNDVDGILPASVIADEIVEGLREKRFMVLPHPSVKTYFGRKSGDYDRWVDGMQKFRRRLLERE